MCFTKIITKNLFRCTNGDFYVALGLALLVWVGGLLKRVLYFFGSEPSLGQRSPILHLTPKISHSVPKYSQTNQLYLSSILVIKQTLKRLLQKITEEYLKVEIKSHLVVPDFENSVSSCNQMFTSLRYSHCCTGFSVHASNL